MKALGMNVTVYTYGQPRTGNPAYANFVDATLPFGKMFRVTHSNDGVPQTVTVAQGYRHHSTEFWQNDPSSVATVVQCTGQEPTVPLLPSISDSRTVTIRSRELELAQMELGLIWRILIILGFPSATP